MNEWLKTSYTYNSSEYDQCSEHVKTAQLMVQEFSVQVRTAIICSIIRPNPEKAQITE